MGDFTKRIKANAAALALPVAIVTTGAGAQQPGESPQLTPETIIKNENCAISATADGFIRCKSDYVSLEFITKHIADIKAKKGDKAPEVITLAVPGPGGMFEQLIPMESHKLEAVADALAGADKNYPVMLAANVQGVHIFVNEESRKGVVVMQAGAVNEVPPRVIADVVKRSISQAKQQIERKAGGRTI